MIRRTRERLHSELRSRCHSHHGLDSEFLGLLLMTRLDTKMVFVNQEAT